MENRVFDALLWTGVGLALGWLTWHVVLEPEPEQSEPVTAEWQTIN